MKEKLSIAEGKGKIRGFPGPRFRLIRKPRRVPNGKNLPQTWPVLIWHTADPVRFIVLLPALKQFTELLLRL